MTTPNFVHIPRIEDEIEDAWQNWLCQTIPTGLGPDARLVFEAGFRCARTFAVPPDAWNPR